MSRLAAAIDVATEYAVHLHGVDGVPAPQAISIGVAAVVRAVRANPGRFVTPRRPQPSAAEPPSALAAVGGTLTALGWLRTIFG